MTEIASAVAPSLTKSGVLISVEKKSDTQWKISAALPADPNVSTSPSLSFVLDSEPSDAHQQKFQSYLANRIDPQGVKSIHLEDLVHNVFGEAALLSETDNMTATGIKFFGHNLGYDVVDSRFERCSFEDLHGAGCRANNSKFKDCTIGTLRKGSYRLTADLAAADLSDTEYEGTKVTAGLVRANLNRSHWDKNSTLAGSDLRGASLEQVTIESNGQKITLEDLAKVALSGIDKSSIDARSALLKLFDGCLFDKQTKMPAELRKFLDGNSVEEKSPPRYGPFSSLQELLREMDQNPSFRGHIEHSSKPRISTYSVDRDERRGHTPFQVVIAPDKVRFEGVPSDLFPLSMFGRQFFQDGELSVEEGGELSSGQMLAAYMTVLHVVRSSRWNLQLEGAEKKKNSGPDENPTPDIDSNEVRRVGGVATDVAHPEGGVKGSSAAGGAEAGAAQEPDPSTPVTNAGTTQPDAGTAVTAAPSDSSTSTTPGSAGSKPQDSDQMLPGSETPSLGSSDVAPGVAGEPGAGADLAADIETGSAPSELPLNREPGPAVSEVPPPADNVSDAPPTQPSAEAETSSPAPESTPPPRVSQTMEERLIQFLKEQKDLDKRNPARTDDHRSRDWKWFIDSESAGLEGADRDRLVVELERLREITEPSLRKELALDITDRR